MRPSGLNLLKRTTVSRLPRIAVKGLHPDAPRPNDDEHDRRTAHPGEAVGESAPFHPFFPTPLHLLPDTLSSRHHNGYRYSIRTSVR